MAPNPFDQFDQASGNPFDQFDAPAMESVTVQGKRPNRFWDDTKPLGDPIDIIAEPIASAVSGTAGTILGGLAGIGAAGTKAVGLTQKDPAEVVQAVQGALTYQPRTRLGSLPVELASYPAEKFEQFADYVGETAQRRGGSPGVAAGFKTAVNAVPALVLRGRGTPRTSRTPGPTPSSAPPATPAATAAGQAGLAQVPSATAAAAVASRAPAAPTGPVSALEAKAQAYVQGKLGIDWAQLPRQAQVTVIKTVRDAKNVDKLDADAVRRQIELQALPVPIPATRGQLMRDPAQLRNEGNVAATEAGRPIREVYLNQNQAILDNLDVLKGRVANRANPAQTPEAVGISVQDQALRAKLELSRQKVKEKYQAAEAAGEMQGKVSPARLIQTIRNSPDKTHFGWVEKWLSDMDVVRKTESGTVTSKLTLKQLEDLRQAAVARAMDGGTEGYYAGKVISAIDQTTDGVGGRLYKDARAARRAQALEFEETGAIARLVENKSRTDRSVALEDTWRKTVIGGSIQDLRNVKRSLLTGGDARTRSAGKRAWRDMKAQTIQHIRDEATKSVALNERGQPNVTPASMKRAIDAIGRDKLDEIFGLGTARRIDGLLEATRTVKTVPPSGYPGSTTFGNILSFLERGLGKVPVVGDVGSGAIRAGIKLREMGANQRVVKESLGPPTVKRNALATTE